MIGVKQKVSLDQSDVKEISDAIRRETAKLIRSQEELIEATSQRVAWASNLCKQNIA